MSHFPVIIYNFNNTIQNLINTKYNEKCFSISSCNFLNVEVPPKLFGFDYIFSDQLHKKIQTIPFILLHQTINNLIQSLISNSVILTINYDETDNKNIKENSLNKKNEFNYIIHYGLMLHSIAWIFDVIAKEPQLSIKISVNKVTHETVFDLIDSEAKNEVYDEPAKENGHLCNDAKQATFFLNQAFQNLNKLNDCQTKNNLDFVIVFTLHLYHNKTDKHKQNKGKIKKIKK